MSLTPEQQARHKLLDDIEAELIKLPVYDLQWILNYASEVNRLVGLKSTLLSDGSVTSKSS